MRDRDPFGHPSEYCSLPDELIHLLTSPIKRFLGIETVAGFFLLFATILANLISNSSLNNVFENFWNMSVGVQLGPFTLQNSLRTWINDALMTMFFFVVALELKRNLVLGELRSLRMAMLSVSAAVGGMLVPAALYFIFQYGEPGQHGWGSVMTTDTAFVIGCLAFLGKRIPQALRIFMLSLAIVDDIGAILVVAIGYGNSIDWLMLTYALAGLLLIKCMAALGVRTIGLYFIVGSFIWIGVDASGVHPTVVGVVLGIMTPTHQWVSDTRMHQILDHIVAFPIGDHWRGNTADRSALRMAETATREKLSPVERLEMKLHPWVGFLVLPLFALSNAGAQLSLTEVGNSITLVIILGFVVGKPLGIVLFSWLAVRMRIAQMPPDLSWKLITGGGILAGIGFTMALFIANLAFDTQTIDAAKLGIYLASIIAGALGISVLIWASRNTARSELELQVPADLTIF